MIGAQGSVERHRGERGLLLLPRLGQHGRGHPRRVVRDDPVDRGAVDGVNILFLGVAYQVVKPMKNIFSHYIFATSLVISCLTSSSPNPPEAPKNLIW